jgi:hypothetical protein
MKKPKQAVQAPAAVRSIPIGTQIPNEGAMMPGTGGQMVSLMESKTEKGLLVMFSCNTCPYVIKAQPRTREAMSIAKKLGIGMVVINSNEAQRDGDDSQPAMAMYADAQGYSVPYVRDEGVMAEVFGAARTPEVFLFNGEGILVYKGAMEDNPAEPEKSRQFYLRDAMRAMVENKPIAIKETKSIGCSIKRRI